MVVRAKDLWSLAWNYQWVDPQELRAAVEDQAIRQDLDYRRRVLIRDSLKALRLFSIRTKDLDDLRALTSHLDKETLARRLHDTCGSMLVAESLRQRAEQNWSILYGEALPT